MNRAAIPRTMQPEFWHERWRTGQIGFHQPTVDRNLKRHWPTLSLGRGSRVLVPLCGKSLDMIWLRDQGHFVVGVELSAAALETFCLENGVSARRRVQGGLDIYEAANLQLFRGDFFTLTSALLGDIAAVYDRGALSSWPPELRPAYVAHLASLVSAGTQMLLNVLEYSQSQMAGPPFSAPVDDLRQLYSLKFKIQEVARQDVLAGEPRLRSRGVSELTEVCYHLVRL
jgi:thiopurine S-methyltransferase